MMRHRLSRLRVWAAIGGVTVLLAACGGGPGEGDLTTGSSVAGTAQPTTEAPTSGEAGTTSEPAQSEAAGDTVRIEISVTDGAISPEPDQLPVPLGSPVRLVVTSDADEEVHLHGYDRTLDLTAGQPGELAFVADLAGIFEAELHGSGALLCELRVE